MRPWRFVTISEPCPVVLYFPDHSLLSPSQDQHGHSVVYQRDRVPGGLGCVLCRRPVFVCCLLDEWREECDVSRYRRLGDVEDVGPYVLDDVLPHISAGNDGRFPEGQFARASRKPGMSGWFAALDTAGSIPLILVEPGYQRRGMWKPPASQRLPRSMVRILTTPWASPRDPSVADGLN